MEETKTGLFLRGDEVWLGTVVCVSDNYGNESEHDVEVMVCTVSEIPDAIHDLVMLASKASKTPQVKTPHPKPETPSTWTEGEQKT